MSGNLENVVVLYPGAWERHARFTMADWAYEVENEDNDHGYAAFVVASCAAMDEAVPPPFAEDAQRAFDELATFDATLTEADRDALDQAYPREDWVREVCDEDTRLGFRLWQIHQRLAHES